MERRDVFNRVRARLMYGNADNSSMRDHVFEVRLRHMRVLAGGRKKWRNVRVTMRYEGSRAILVKIPRALLRVRCSCNHETDPGKKCIYVDLGSGLKGFSARVESDSYVIRFKCADAAREAILTELLEEACGNGGYDTEVLTDVEPASDSDTE